jgi:hypothetical protein
MFHTVPVVTMSCVAMTKPAALVQDDNLSVTEPNGKLSKRRT